MELTDVESVIDKCVEIAKLLHRRSSSTINKELQEPYEGYDKIVDAYHEALVHAEGQFPEKLFAAASPLMSADELAYLRASYQPETTDVYIQFANTLKRSLANGELHIEPIGENTIYADALKDYVANDIDVFNTMDAFMAALSDHKVIDAMGCVGVWPEDIPMRPSTDGTMVIDGQPKPQPKVYAAPDVMYHKDDCWLCISGKKSIVEYQGKQVEAGLVFHWYDSEYVIEISQTGIKSDHAFEVTLIYEHFVGYTPMIQLQGVATIKRNKVLYIAPFQYAVPYLNLAALDSTTLLIIKRKVGFPTRVVVQEKCQFQSSKGMCNNGIIQYFDGDKEVTETCSNCKGTGYIGVFGPMSELRINSQPGFGEQASNVTASNAMSYVSPSVDIPKFYAEEVDRRIARAEHSMHLKAEPRKTGDITATEKTINAKNTEAFVRPFSDQLWDIFKFLVESMGRMMFTHDIYEDNVKLTVTYPKSFDLIKPEDYIQAIGEAVKQGLPTVIIQEMVYQYFQLIGDESYGDLIADADRLLSIDKTDVALGISRGTVQPWEAILHQSAGYIVYKLLREVPNFTELERSEQIALMQEQAKLLVSTSEFALPAPEL